jgi:hypothetical protein
VPDPAHLWLADIPAPLDRPVSPVRPVSPASSQPIIEPVHEPGTQTGEQRREVGTRRRHLEGYRQRPDLRVINGDGTGTGQSRSGRLRAVPPREITGGRPGPQQ